MTLTAPGVADPSTNPPDELPSLSPSRAADFKTCPLLYPLRSIDRPPEAPSIDQVRGTVVHAVLERLFDLPAHGRTLQAAQALLGPQSGRRSRESPELAEVVPPERSDEFFASARHLLAGYFALEDPTRLPAGEREVLIEAVVHDQLRLRGYVDRLDTAPTGDLRVVDYKTGSAPR